MRKTQRRFWASAALLVLGSTMLAGCKPGVTRHYLQEVPAKPAKASDVLLTSLSHVPGYYIRTTGGVDCRWLSFDDNQNYQKLFSGAMAGLQKDALKGGYNAVVNFRVSNGTWEAQGSAWRVLMTQLCGDDVEVARK